MQQTSATWKQLLAAGAALEARATIGGVVYTDISAPVIRRAAMQNTLSIGNVAAASLSLVIRGAGVVPRSAAVVVEARLNDGTATSEWLPQGTFYISRRARDPVTGLLALECYDALLKAQAVVTELPWTTKDGTPITTAGGDRILFRAAPVGDMGRLAKDMALLLGLRVDARSVIRSGAPYEITSPNEGATIRDILSIIAQANGGNWIVTPQNQLRLVPVADVAGAAGATGDAVDVDGVTGGIRISAAEAITGLRGTLENDTWMIGDDTGLVLDVGVTPVIATELAEAMIGRRCQAYSLEGAVCDPAAELGDFVRAGANGEVASALYSQQITLGPACRSDMASPGGGEITDEYPYIGSAAKTLALARATVKEAVNRLDNALTQQEIFNRLTDNGAAQGLVLYNGQLYVNASYINTGYLDADRIAAQSINGTKIAAGAISADKIAAGAISADMIMAGEMSADRIQGGTLKLGGINNVNGELSILDENGVLLGRISNLGIGFVDNNIGHGIRIYKNGRIEVTEIAVYSSQGQMAVIDPLTTGGLAISDANNNPIATFGPGGVGVKTSFSVGAVNGVYFVVGQNSISLLTPNGRIWIQQNGDIEITGNVTMSKRPTISSGGATGSFTTADGKLITVTEGFITNII
ncbi:MAG: hypothetical protein IKD58_12720 [Loktanella sp.]|nr:hypothetical protein [Loktanella sp.]